MLLDDTTLLGINLNTRVSVIATLLKYLHIIGLICNNMDRYTALCYTEECHTRNTTILKQEKRKTNKPYRLHIVLLYIIVQCFKCVTKIFLFFDTNPT